MWCDACGERLENGVCPSPEDHCSTCGHGPVYHFDIHESGDGCDKCPYGECGRTP